MSTKDKHWVLSDEQKQAIRNRMKGKHNAQGKTWTRSDAKLVKLIDKHLGHAKHVLYACVSLNTLGPGENRKRKDKFTKYRAIYRLINDMKKINKETFGDLRVKADTSLEHFLDMLFDKLVLKQYLKPVYEKYIRNLPKEITQDYFILPDDKPIERREYFYEEKQNS